MTRRKLTRFESPAPFVQVVRQRDGRAAYRARVMHAGKRVPSPVRVTVAEAQADAAEIQRKAEFVPADVLTFRRAVEQARDAMVGRDVKQGTLNWFDSHRKHAEKFFGDELLHRIKPAGIDSFLAWRRRTGTVQNSGLQHDRRLLVMVFERATWTGALIRNPLLGYQWPNAENEPPEFFLPAEFGTLLQKIRDSGEPSAEHDAGLIAILANSGLRLSEIARLRVADVNLRDGLFYIRAKRKPRRVEVRPGIVAHLARMIAGRHSFAHRQQEFLIPPFTDDIETEVTRVPLVEVAHQRRTEFVTRALARWSGRLSEKRLHAHALRHTCGVALALAGKSVPQIMGVLGNTHDMAIYYANVTAAMEGKGLADLGLSV